MASDSVVFGKKYRDKFTGIEGIAVGRTEWVTGCDQIGLQRVVENEIKTDWFDISRIEGVVIAPELQKTGGPQPTPRIGNRR